MGDRGRILESDFLSASSPHSPPLLLVMTFKMNTQDTLSSYIRYTLTNIVRSKAVAIKWKTNAISLSFTVY
jgi:hypothetical protein